MNGAYISVTRSLQRIMAAPADWTGGGLRPGWGPHCAPTPLWTAWLISLAGRWRRTCAANAVRNGWWP